VITIAELFYVYIRSSFGGAEKKQLYDYIWNHYRRRIAFYISGYVSPSHPGFDDLLQEVMIKIYKSLHTFTPPHSFKAWTYQIARRHCLDFLKSRQERQAPAPLPADPPQPGAGSPESRLMQSELFDLIDRSLRSLPPLDQEISFLRFYENLRYREIARIVGVNANSVKARIHEIKEKLKKDLSA
jgi:RNA polymerase sigma factor (sigma-70 family)